jgi:putative DNA primase/helicase
LQRLEKLIKEIGKVSLIMIDPITGYLGDKIDSHQTTAVRSILEPVARFAEKNAVSILAITHPPKAQQQKAIQTFTGSFAFAAAGRIAFIVVEDADDADGRKLLLPVKTNIGKMPDGIGYSIQGTTIDNGRIETSHIQYDAQPVLVTADEAIKAARADKVEQAEQFLTDFLNSKNDKQALATEILAEGKAKGFSQRTLYTAKTNANIRSDRTGFGADAQSVWRMPY